MSSHIQKYWSVKHIILIVVIYDNSYQFEDVTIPLATTFSPTLSEWKS